jgi:hypothetical protein
VRRVALAAELRVEKLPVSAVSVKEFTTTLNVVPTDGEPSVMISNVPPSAMFSGFPAEPPVRREGAAAQTAADSISGAVTLAYGPTADEALVTVTTGSDLSVNQPVLPDGCHLDDPEYHHDHPAVEWCIQRADRGGRAADALGLSILHGAGR